MIRKIFAVAAFATVVATPALAAESQIHSFVRDGVSYSYRTIQKGDVTVLQGTGENRDLRLEVRGDKVSGTVNGARVAFNVSDMNELNADAEQASN